MKKSSVKMLCVFAALVIFTIIWFILNGKHNEDTTHRVITYNQLMASGIYFLVYILILIISRVRKDQSVLKAILLYYLVGVFSYIIIMFMSILTNVQQSNFVMLIFRCWVYFVEPLGIVISRAIVRVSERDTIGFIIIILAFISAMTLSELQKSIKWDKRKAIEAAEEEMRLLEREERAGKTREK